MKWKLKQNEKLFEEECHSSCREEKGAPQEGWLIIITVGWVRGRFRPDPTPAGPLQSSLQ